MSISKKLKGKVPIAEGKNKKRLHEFKKSSLLAFLRSPFTIFAYKIIKSNDYVQHTNKCFGNP